MLGIQSLIQNSGKFSNMFYRVKIVYRLHKYKIIQPETTSPNCCVRVRLQ